MIDLQTPARLVPLQDLLFQHGPLDWNRIAPGNFGRHTLTFHTPQRQAYQTPQGDILTAFPRYRQWLIFLAKPLIDGNLQAACLEPLPPTQLCLYPQVSVDALFDLSLVCGPEAQARWTQMQDQIIERLLHENRPGGLWTWMQGDSCLSQDRHRYPLPEFLKRDLTRLLDTTLFPAVSDSFSSGPLAPASVFSCNVPRTRHETLEFWSGKEKT